MLADSVWLRVAQVSAWVLAAALIVPIVLNAVLLVLGPQPANADPHGYVLIFGMLFLALLAIPALVSVNAAIATTRRRRRGAWISVVLGVVLMWAGPTLVMSGQPDSGPWPLALAVLPMASATAALIALFTAPAPGDSHPR